MSSIGECSCKPVLQAGIVTFPSFKISANTMMKWIEAQHLTQSALLLPRIFFNLHKSKGQRFDDTGSAFQFPRSKTGRFLVCVCTYLVGRFESRTSMSCRFRSNKYQGTGNHSTRTPRRPSNLIIHSICICKIFLASCFQEWSVHCRQYKQTRYQC